ILSPFFQKLSGRNRGKSLVFIQIQMQTRLLLDRSAQEKSVCQSAEQQRADEVAPLPPQPLGRQAYNQHRVTVKYVIKRHGRAGRTHNRLNERITQHPAQPVDNYLDVVNLLSCPQGSKLSPLIKDIGISDPLQTRATELRITEKPRDLC